MGWFDDITEKFKDIVSPPKPKVTTGPTRYPTPKPKPQPKPQPVRREPIRAERPKKKARKPTPPPKPKPQPVRLPPIRAVPKPTPPPVVRPTPPPVRLPPIRAERPKPTPPKPTPKPTPPPVTRPPIVLPPIRAEPKPTIADVVKEKIKETFEKIVDREPEVVTPPVVVTPPTPEELAITLPPIRLEPKPTVADVVKERVKDIVKETFEEVKERVKEADRVEVLPEIKLEAPTTYEKIDVALGGVLPYGAPTAEQKSVEKIKQDELKRLRSEKASLFQATEGEGVSYIIPELGREDFFKAQFNQKLQGMVSDDDREIQQLTKDIDRNERYTITTAEGIERTMKGSKYMEMIKNDPFYSSESRRSRLISKGYAEGGKVVTGKEYLEILKKDPYFSQENITAMATAKSLEDTSKMFKARLATEKYLEPITKIKGEQIIDYFKSAGRGITELTTGLSPLDTIDPIKKYIRSKFGSPEFQQFQKDALAELKKAGSSKAEFKKFRDKYPDVGSIVQRYAIEPASIKDISRGLQVAGFGVALVPGAAATGLAAGSLFVSEIGEVERERRELGEREDITREEILGAAGSAFIGGLGAGVVWKGAGVLGKTGKEVLTAKAALAASKAGTTKRLALLSGAKLIEGVGYVTEREIAAYFGSEVAGEIYKAGRLTLEQKKMPAIYSGATLGSSLAGFTIGGKVARPIIETGLKVSGRGVSVIPELYRKETSFDVTTEILGGGKVRKPTAIEKKRLEKEWFDIYGEKKTFKEGIEPTEMLLTRRGALQPSKDILVPRKDVYETHKGKELTEEQIFFRSDAPLKEGVPSMVISPSPLFTKGEGKKWIDMYKENLAKVKEEGIIKAGLKQKREALQRTPIATDVIVRLVGKRGEKVKSDYIKMVSKDFATKGKITETTYKKIGAEALKDLKKEQGNVFKKSGLAEMLKNPEIKKAFERKLGEKRIKEMGLSEKARKFEFEMEEEIAIFDPIRLSKKDAKIDIAFIPSGVKVSETKFGETKVKGVGKEPVAVISGFGARAPYLKRVEQSFFPKKFLVETETKFALTKFPIQQKFAERAVLPGGHAFPHMKRVQENVLKMMDVYPETKQYWVKKYGSIEKAKEEMGKTLYHDLWKRGETSREFLEPFGLGHGEVAYKSWKKYKHLFPKELQFKPDVAKAIGQHSVLDPRSKQYKLLDKLGLISLESKFLATADRLDLARYGIRPDKKQLPMKDALERLSPKNILEMKDKVSDVNLKSFKPKTIEKIRSKALKEVEVLEKKLGKLDYKDRQKLIKQKSSEISEKFRTDKAFKEKIKKEKLTTKESLKVKESYPMSTTKRDFNILSGKLAIGVPITERTIDESLIYDRTLPVGEREIIGVARPTPEEPDRDYPIDYDPLIPSPRIPTPEVPDRIIPPPRRDDPFIPRPPTPEEPEREYPTPETDREYPTPEEPDRDYPTDYDYLVPKPRPPTVAAGGFNLKIPSRKPKRVKKVVKKGKAYDSYGKIVGKKKYKRLNQVPLSRRKALDLSSYVIDHSLSTNFYIKHLPGKKPQTPKIKVPDNYFGGQRKNLRNYRIRKGKKVPMERPDMFIERKGKARLSTKSEINRINLLKKLAELKKKSKKTIIKKKVVKRRSRKKLARRTKSKDLFFR